jgi:hypothetical protein
VMATVHASPAAIAHRGALERALDVPREQWSAATPVTPL